MSPVARRIASLLGVRPDTPPLPDPTPHPPCSMILTVVFVLKSWGPRTDLFSTVSGGSHHGLIFLRDEIVLEKSGRRVINEDKMCVNSLHSRATRVKKNSNLLSGSGIHLVKTAALADTCYKTDQSTAVRAAGTGLASLGRLSSALTVSNEKVLL